MKKTISLICVLALALSLAACGSDPAPSGEAVITRASQSPETTEAASAETTLPVGPAVPTFTLEKLALVPGAALDPETLPEALSSYTAPSCAIEGSEHIFTYKGFELTILDDGKTKTLYSIYLLEPGAATDQGLAVGDPLEKAATLYGSEFETAGTSHVYTYEGMKMSVIAENDVIISIGLVAEP